MLQVAKTGMHDQQIQNQRPSDIYVHSHVHTDALHFRTMKLYPDLFTSVLAECFFDKPTLFFPASLV